MALPILAGLGATLVSAAAVVSDTSTDINLNQDAALDDLDMKQGGGVLLSTSKIRYPVYGNLISQFSPVAVPLQRSTQDVTEVYQDFSRAIVESSNQQVGYLFRDRLGHAPRATADQSAPLVELPTVTSQFSQDTTGIINNYPLTYYNWAAPLPGTGILQPFMEPSFARAGYSTENQMPRRDWPLNPYNMSSNPWGPGGSLIDLWNQLTNPVSKKPPKSVVLQTPAQ